LAFAKAFLLIDRAGKRSFTQRFLKKNKATGRDCNENSTTSGHSGDNLLKASKNP